MKSMKSCLVFILFWNIARKTSSQDNSNINKDAEIEYPRVPSE